MTKQKQTPASEWEPKEVNGKVYVPIYTEGYGVPMVFWQTYEDWQDMNELES